MGQPTVINFCRPYVSNPSLAVVIATLRKKFYYLFNFQTLQVMQISQEMALRDFPFWSGARQFASRLTDTELSIIEEYLMDYYDGIVPSMTDINDIFWFEDTMLIVDILGYDYDEFWKRQPFNEK